MELRAQFQRLISIPYIAQSLALLGGLTYVIQAVNHAHNQISILDEGAYLYKGYLYATGQFFPFQEYGPWGNHMPFSFLIPGYIQAMIGPGLRTGRYFSIFLALLLLVGLWIAANRLGGRWWAAGAVWAVALNPMYIRVYSSAYSQVLVACLLMWVLVLVLNEKAGFWQLGLAGTLGGLMLLTRLNMVIVLPLLIGYIFWQHGWRAGLVAMAAGVITVLAGHLLFWPGIMQLWASWLPSSLTPFLDTWRVIDTGSAVWQPNLSSAHRWLSFLYGIRFNFVALVGLFGLGVLCLQPRSWISGFFHRSAAFLGVLLALLTVAHAWVALGNDFCVYCFQGYLTFFSPAAILLIVISFRGWRGTKSSWFVLFILALVLLTSIGIGYSIFKDLGAMIIELTLPRFKEGQIAAGSITLWGLLENGFNIPYQTSRKLVPSFLGFAVGMMVLVIAWLVHKRFKSRQQGWGNLGLLTLGLFLVLGMLISPTRVLGNGYQDNDCGLDVIAAHEAAGQYLAEVIPPGSQVYWQGSESVVPMLYLPGVSLYPPQINSNYTYRIGGNTQEILRIGLWNDELAEKWKREADFVIIDERSYNSDWKAFLESGNFEELPRSPSTAPCREDARLRIFPRRDDD